MHALHRIASINANTVSRNNIDITSGSIAFVDGIKTMPNITSRVIRHSRQHRFRKRHTSATKNGSLPTGSDDGVGGVGEGRW
eukprot:1203418-Rhodomonas_salina.5